MYGITVFNEIMHFDLNHAAFNQYRHPLNGIL